MNFQAAVDAEIGMQDWDSLYPNALNSDTTVYAVFRGREEEFVASYQSFMQNPGALEGERLREGRTDPMLQ